MEDFGTKLKTLRESKGLSQTELAKELFVTRSAVAKWEQDRGFPNIESLRHISRLFEVSIDDLVSDKEIKILEVTANKKLSLRTKLVIILSVFLAAIIITGSVLLGLFCPRKLSAYLKIRSDEVVSIYIYQEEYDSEGNYTGNDIKVYVSENSVSEFLENLKKLKIIPRYNSIKGKGAYPIFIETNKGISTVYMYEFDESDKRFKYYIETDEYLGFLKNYFTI